MLLLSLIFLSSKRYKVEDRSNHLGEDSTAKSSATTSRAFKKKLDTSGKSIFTGIKGHGSKAEMDSKIKDGKRITIKTVDKAKYNNYKKLESLGIGIRINCFDRGKIEMVEGLPLDKAM